METLNNISDLRRPLPNAYNPDFKNDHYCICAFPHTDLNVDTECQTRGWHSNRFLKLTKSLSNVAWNKSKDRNESSLPMIVINCSHIHLFNINKNITTESPTYSREIWAIKRSILISSWHDIIHSSKQNKNKNKMLNIERQNREGDRWFKPDKLRESPTFLFSLSNHSNFDCQWKCPLCNISFRGRSSTL